MLVTVVIPTFDRRALVREAVASVLAQGDSRCELIVVDDGSRDGTAAALRAEFGMAITVLETPNRGVSAARNLGVQYGRGEIIAFLDSDDLWRPGKLAAQRACFADAAVSICQTQEIWMRDGRRVNPADRHRKLTGRLLVPSLRRCLVSPSAVAMRRSLFERHRGFDETLPACEDYDLWLRIAVDTPIHLIDCALVVRRAGHPDQLSRRYWGMDRFRVRSLARLLREAHLDPAERDAAARVLTEKCTILATGAERRGRHADADAYRKLAAAHG